LDRNYKDPEPISSPRSVRLEKGTRYPKFQVAIHVPLDILAGREFGQYPDAAFRVPKVLPVVKRLDPQWVDMSDLHAKMEACSRTHSHICTWAGVSKPEQMIFSVKPAWVVDVQCMCIVPSTGRKQYIALSYVWGQTVTLKLLRSNQTELEKEGALLIPRNWATIPRTIKDAIKLVQELGERYLWVDSLCIHQDPDDSSNHDQINNMSTIYANASVTIIAVQGVDAAMVCAGFLSLALPDKMFTVLVESFNWSQKCP
jgi:hypothetical protein